MSVKKGEIRVKNHFVPEGYLKKWSGSDGKIFTYKTLVQHEKVNHWRSYHPSSIAYHKHLYTMQIAGDENDDLERWFDNEFESPALPIIEKVVSGRKLINTDWNILIKYLACQDIRTPVRLIEHIKIMQKILPETLDEIMEDIAKEMSAGRKITNTKEAGQKGYEDFPLKIEKRKDDGSEYGILRATSYVGRASWFFSIKYILERTSIKLHQHKWSIVKPHPGLYWPTSDNPVIKLNYLESGEYDLKGGWGVTNGVIFLPLGPEHAMFLQIGTKSSERKYICSEMETLLFKKFICENAHRMVFANNIDNDILLFRKRVVDENQVKIEQKQFDDWVSENSRLENEFNKGYLRTP